MDELNMDVEEQEEGVLASSWNLCLEDSDEDSDKDSDDDFDDDSDDEEEQEVSGYPIRDDKIKWNFLEHKGPVFPRVYEPLPDEVKFYFKKEEMKLSIGAEEVATFYACMLKPQTYPKRTTKKTKRNYTTEKIFNDNFFHDWREVMTETERSKITDLKHCDFTEMQKYLDQKRKELEAMSKAIEEKNKKEYGICVIDGNEEQIDNFNIEPPGLYKGRGKHPKMGKLKKRVQPEDVTINCSEDSVQPEAPPGHRWRKVEHIKTVSWLAKWTDNVLERPKYIRLSPASKFRGEIDKQKFDTAKKLGKIIDKIRQNYRQDWESNDMLVKQRAVALYLIDVLALRAGNKNESNTYGCCNLKKEHVQLHEEKDGKKYVVVLNFLGKDSMPYYNDPQVEERVFRLLQSFKENRSDGGQLFDRLTAPIMNKYLNECMEGLTAKVFRTYNASFKLQEELRKLTNSDNSEEKIRSCKEALKTVACLCNHKRTNPRTGLEEIKDVNTKLHYIDPRIIVAWCKKYGVPIEKIYTIKQREKFKWAMNTGRDFVFA